MGSCSGGSVIGEVLLFVPQNGPLYIKTMNSNSELANNAYGTKQES